MKNLIPITTEKFKEGDKVRILDGRDIKPMGQLFQDIGWSDYLNLYIGRKAFVKQYEGDGVTVSLNWLDGSDKHTCWDENWLELTETKEESELGKAEKEYKKALNMFKKSEQKYLKDQSFFNNKYQEFKKKLIQVRKDEFEAAENELKKAEFDILTLLATPYFCQNGTERLHRHSEALKNFEKLENDNN